MANHPEPRTLIEAVRYFADPVLAFDFVKGLRWPDGKVTCPRCNHAEVSFLTTRHIWKCKGCRKQFSLKVGTVFEDSPLGWDKWLPAVWLLANSKNSVSSHELGRALGVTQKTAWFVLHRIRDAMATGSFQRFTGTTEVDDTFVGGKSEYMHHRRRQERMVKHGGAEHMTIVQGVRNRDSGTVQAEAIDGRDVATIQPNIYEWVEPGSALYTDTAAAYNGLEQDYAMKQVDHHRKQYVSGDVSTNGIENFWSVLKRSIKGTQIHVDPDHLGRYVTERVFAFNNRDAGDLGRMQAALAGTAGRRLTWADLTDKMSSYSAPKPWRPSLSTIVNRVGSSFFSQLQ